MRQSESCGPVLEIWKAMAEAENRRARATWGPSGGGYGRPQPCEDPAVTAARRQRDDEIVALRAAGLSAAEIGRQFELAERTVTRILRLDRLEKNAVKR